MELQLPSFTFIFSIFLFVIIGLKMIQGPKQSKTSKLPPGPPKLPIIGNMHQLFGSVPHRLLTDLARRYGPLMHLQLGELSTVVISSAGIAEEVFKTNDINFSERPNVLYFKILTYNQKGIFSSVYGNYWRKVRKISTMELLNAKRVQSFRSIREQEVLSLIETIYSNEGSVVNLTEKIFDLTYGITARAAFGDRSKDQAEAFKLVTRKMVDLSSGFHVADFFPSIEVLPVISGMKSKLEKVHQESDRIIESIIKEHRENKATTPTKSSEDNEDLVDVFLRLQKAGDPELSLTDTNIKAIITEIFAAGSDTSSTALEWAMSEMIKNPRVMKQAQAEVRRVFSGKPNVDETGIDELKFLKLVVKETLRLHPSAPLSLPRENKESCVINGYEIPAKSRVLFNLWAIGRDPKYWDEPDKFYPERFLDSSIDFRGTNFEYLPFGVGRRVCPGISFAIPNIELPLAQLLYHFDWKLPNGMNLEDLDMTELHGLAVKRKSDLLLIPTSFHQSSNLK